MTAPQQNAMHLGCFKHAECCQSTESVRYLRLTSPLLANLFHNLSELALHLCRHKFAGPNCKISRPLKNEAPPTIQGAQVKIHRLKLWMPSLQGKALKYSQDLEIMIAAILAGYRSKRHHNFLWYYHDARICSVLMPMQVMHAAKKKQG